MLLSFFRIIKFGWQNFFRNIWLSIVTIIIIVLALFSISSLLIFNILTENTLQVVQAKTDVIIDLKPNTDIEQANLLVESLAQVPTIAEVKYLSPEENLKNFLGTYENNNLISEAINTLDSNPFKASILLKVDKIENFPLILEELSQDKYLQILEIKDDDFTQTKKLVNKLSDYSQKIKKTGLIISLIFILIAVLVIFNAIEMSIYSRKEEISIMRLVGASNYFIKGPFYVEGIIYSILSMIILVIVIYPVLMLIQPYINNFFSEYATNIVEQVNKNFLKIFGYELLIAILINIVSSSIAMKKYLKI